MLRALMTKEWRELWPIALIAFLSYGAATAAITGSRLGRWLSFLGTGPSSVPFADNVFFQRFLFVSVPFLIALGFRQTLGEDFRGTFLYLLHKPMQRTNIILSKLLAGWLIYAVVSLIIILWYLVWAATPGHHPSPFDWTMTIWTWQAWLVAPVIYLGAFLSGLLPGKWYGRKLLPLIASLLFLLISANFPWHWVGILVGAMTAALLLVNIVSVAAERDYA